MVFPNSHKRVSRPGSANPATAHYRTLVLIGIVAVISSGSGSLCLSQDSDAAQEDGSSQVMPVREPWTTSRVTGSPDPPPALRTVLRFPQLKFEHPLLLRRDSASRRLWVAEQPGRIRSFPDNDAVTATDLFVDLRASWSQLTPHTSASGVGAVYGLAFHPDYPRVPVCWITYTLDSAKAGEALEDGTRLSRFHVQFDGDGIPRCDVGSEKIVLTWLAGGHNGACLEFGPDGFLYVSAGDGEVPNPPDPRDAGQDVSNLLSTIMRIDVLAEGDDPLYRVPADNPFVDLPGARPEIWSYGFRNPWKMTFAPDGELWVGDVGWEMYEMVYRIRRGGNFGWSITEGPQPVRPTARRGPTEILPAAIALPHSDAASVTGGYVYRGSRFPELVGSYVFGDFETRRVWSAVFEGERLVSLTDLVRPSVRLVAMAEDAAGELLLVDYDAGTIHGLERNPPPTETADFPQRLSQTGLFKDLLSQRPANGVTSFEINAAMWHDGATASRWLAVPGEDKIEVQKRNIRRTNWMWRESMFFPDDSVLAKTLTLRDKQNKDVRLETQLLHFDGTDWRGYSYVWNTEQTDAVLAPAGGQEISLKDYGEFPGRSAWQVHSRAECLRCHNHWAGGPLAFTAPQLNREIGLTSSAAAAAAGSASAPGNQLHHLRDAGWLKGAIPEQGTKTNDAWAVPAADPASTDDSPDKRARAWLQVNCAHCHQNGAGGTATIDLQSSIPADAMKLLGAAPSQGTFGLNQPQLVVPGDPARSVLMYRVAVAGRGRMPHIGSSVVDAGGVELIRQWIESLAADSPNATSDSPSKVPGEFSDSTEALRWLARMDSQSLTGPDREALLQTARQSPPEISGLFERFQPAELRRHIRTRIDSEAVLAQTGEASRGAELFADKRLQCINCHQVGGKGGSVGPALDDIGKRFNREQILQSLLEPSLKIDPKFTTWVVQTTDGRVATGLLMERTASSVVLRTTKPEDLTFARSDIEELLPQAVSLMPDRLLNDMTDQEIAGLVEFLSNQRAGSKP